MIFFKYKSFKWDNAGNLLQDDKATYTYNDFNKGKGKNSIKIAIHIDINEEQYKKFIDLYNK